LTAGMPCLQLSDLGAALRAHEGIEEENRT
jgi:hypothetical protein